MEEKQDLQQFLLCPKLIRQGFSNQLKELTLLNKHSPRIFMIYAPRLNQQEAEGEPAESLIAKQMQGYLNPTIEVPCPSRNNPLKLNLYSAFAPQGNGSDAHNEYKTDVLYNQLCLLPKHLHSVDYVIFCGSYLLQEYFEIKEVVEYTNYLHTTLSRELSKQNPDFPILYTKAENALSILKDRYSTENQQFHSFYTELAFLALRKEAKTKAFLPSHDLITILIDSNPIAIHTCLPQDNSIYMGTLGRLEKDPRAFYLGIFQLLSRLFGKPELEACRAAIGKAHSVFINNTEPTLWPLEEAKELAEQHNTHEEAKRVRQRARAKSSFFELSTSSEEESFIKASSKPIYKTTTTSIDTAELTETLRTLYQQNYAKLPRLFSEETEAITDTFVNVAILKEEVVKKKERELDAAQKKEGKQGNATEMQDNRLQSHEQLYEAHETIAIGELFAPLSATLSPKKLLLYGRAGIGKTVLCQYLANQWAEKSDAKADNMACFRQFQAVFWIPLRQLLDRLEGYRKRGRLIQEEMMVAEMVTMCCLRDSSWQKATRKQQLQIWLEKNVEKTLFILDGYDEIAETVSTSSALSDCLNAVLNQVQYRPYVMLTSRPITIHSQYGSFDRRLECMGFIDKNIPVFIERYLKDLQQSKNCLTFLKSHPSIWGTAHIPLNLELLCLLWSKGELSLGNSCFTMTALYSRITTKMKEINVEEQKHPNLRAKWQYANNPSSETTFADFAEEFFPFLGFHAMQQTGVLLSGRYIKQLLGIFIKAQDIDQKEGSAFEDKQRKLLQACVDLSFLKSTQQGGKHIFDHTYYFIHLSFQEFFAAKYYQETFEHSNTVVIEHFRVHKYTPSYQLTWWMCAGLLYQHRNYSGLNTFFETLHAPPLDLIGIHHTNLLSHCLDECQADEKIYVIARLIQHLAKFLKHLLEKDELTMKNWDWSWSETLLHCPNLLRAKSLQNIGLRFFENLKQINVRSLNAATLLSHLATKKVFACLRCRTTKPASLKNITQALAERSDLTPEQIQHLFFRLERMEIHSAHLILAQRPNLTLKQLQFFIACLTSNTSINQPWNSVILANTLAQHPDLTPEQIQSLIVCLTNTTINNNIRETLAKALAQRSNLTPEQVQSLIVCLIDTTISDKVRGYLAEALVQHPDLTPEQIQSLITCSTNTKIDDDYDWTQAILTQGLVKHLSLTSKQVQSLIVFFTNAPITYKGDDGDIRIYLVKPLVQRSDLTPEQIQFLITYVTEPGGWVHKSLANALIQRSDLTLEQAQSLIACLADTTIDSSVYKALTKALVQHANQTPEQAQSIIAHVTNTTIDNDWIPAKLTQILTQHLTLSLSAVECLIANAIYTTINDWVHAQPPGLTPRQVQSLLCCTRDTMYNYWFRRELTQALLTQRSDLTPEQIQSLVACIPNTTIDSWIRKKLAQPFAQRSDLTPEQLQSLIAYIPDTTIDYQVHNKLIQTLLTPCSDLTPEQVQSLIACLADTTTNNQLYERAAQVLVKRPNITPEQVQFLITCLTDTEIGSWICEKLPQAFAQRSDLTSEQLQSLIACISNTTIYHTVRRKIAQKLPRHPNLTPEQVQSLIACLADGMIDKWVCYTLARTLTQRSDLTPKQVQSLIAYLADSTIDQPVRQALAEALVQRSDLTLEQVQSLIAYLTALIHSGAYTELAKALVQHVSLNVQELQQLLVSCLENKILCKDYPFLIFSILLLYYSTSTIEQQHTIFPDLVTFLIRPSTWSELAKQHALFFYDEIKGIALLHLGTQTVKIPLYLHHNPFPLLSYEIWGGNLYQIETEDDSSLQKIGHTLLLGQAKKIVTTPTSTTMNTTLSTVPSHKPYETICLTNSDNTLQPNIHMPTLKRNKLGPVVQESCSFSGKIAAESTAPRLELTQVLKNLIEDSINITKQYSFQLKRVNTCLLTITFISSNESSRAEGRQLNTLQREMEACLQAANLKNYICKLKGKEEEILKVTGDKEIIDALADLLVRQGLSMRLAEANKYRAFFKAEKVTGEGDSSTLTCPMQ